MEKLEVERMNKNMAISTYRVFLMKKGSTGNTYEKLIDIKEFPDLGGDPEMLETTTLSDKMQTYIAGIQSLDALSPSRRTTPWMTTRSWWLSTERPRATLCGSAEPVTART